MKVVIVGAGMSGLVAARALTEAGAEVTVIDKGRSVGGRMATRRIGAGVLDHGAQFFTVRTPAFRSRVDDWLERGVVRVWNHGFEVDDGYPRYVGTAGMNSIAKDLATELRVETSTMAFTVRAGSGTERWEVVIDDGTVRPADAVILTCPMPQTIALLVDAGIDFGGPMELTEYDRTIGLLVTLDRDVELPGAGGVQEADDVFSFIGDNAHKGVSSVPSVTFHARPTWSEEHWDDDTLIESLRSAAAPWIGEASIIDAQVKKWRMATPREVWPDPCWTTEDDTIVLAGDVFAGPKVEGAHNSGLAAAHALLG
ncbi:NAD(P)/FAD-dependent oxidoreductase [Ilumatobacter nonamiensis]|uniref:NAD(P)/FAD-dependent oxidoreductase n=1 Tax=Ilumatobacter nonamiensis TaxID=467093 RepID=UPI00034C62E0|nr:FAD-dependent oxidoreductase [Ilumatobacter nonamiensis]